MAKRKLVTIALLMLLAIPLAGYLFRGKNFYYQYATERPLFLGWYLEDSKIMESFNVDNYDNILEMSKISKDDPDILPKKFWKALQDQYVSQKDYINNTGFFRALRLEYYNFRANYYYKKDLLDYKRAISKMFPESQEQPLVNVGSSTNNRVINQDLEMLSKNSSQLNIEIWRRILILFGFKSPRYDLENIQIEKPKEVGLDSIKSIDELFWGPGVKNIRGPYLVNTGCFGRGSAPFYLFDFEYMGKNVSAVKLATENYYEKLSPSIKVEEKYLNEGLDWKPIREGNSYRCNDLSYQAELFTTDYVISNLRQQKLLDKFNGRNNVISEKTNYILDENNLVSYADIQELGNLYLSEYNSETDPDIKKYYLKHFLIIKNKDISIGKIFETGLYLDELYLRLKDKQINDIGKKFIYLTRNPYSITFLAFSDSSYLSKENLRYFSDHYKSNQFISESELKKIDQEFDPKSLWFLTDIFLLSN